MFVEFSFLITWVIFHSRTYPLQFVAVQFNPRPEDTNVGVASLPRYGDCPHKRLSLHKLLAEL